MALPLPRYAPSRGLSRDSWVMGCRVPVERRLDLPGRLERCIRQIREDGDDHAGITVQAEHRGPADRAAAVERPAVPQAVGPQKPPDPVTRFLARAGALRREQQIQRLAL